MSSDQATRLAKTALRRGQLSCGGNGGSREGDVVQAANEYLSSPRVEQALDSQVNGSNRGLKIFLIILSVIIVLIAAWIIFVTMTGRKTYEDTM